MVVGQVPPAESGACLALPIAVAVHVVPHPTRPNEDTFCVASVRLPESVAGNGATLLAGVYDGHGGLDASGFLASSLHSYVEAAAATAEGAEDVPAVLQAAFSAAETGFAPKSDNVGSTATVALLAPGNHITVANVGDSRALLLRRSGEVLSLTEDHRPKRADERARILSCGGEILWNEGERVMGVLGTTRAFGDRDLKAFGVISEPEITTVARTDDDDLLILATDGVFNVQTNREVADVARRIVARATERGATRAAAVRMAASAIGRFSRDRNSKDDITVLVLDLAAGTPATTPGPPLCFSSLQMAPASFAPPHHLPGLAGSHGAGTCCAGLAGAPAAQPPQMPTLMRTKATGAYGTYGMPATPHTPYSPLPLAPVQAPVACSLSPPAPVLAGAWGAGAVPWPPLPFHCAQPLLGMVQAAAHAAASDCGGGACAGRPLQPPHPYFAPFTLQPSLPVSGEPSPFICASGAGGGRCGWSGTPLPPHASPLPPRPTSASDCRATVSSRLVAAISSATGMMAHAPHALHGLHCQLAPGAPGADDWAAALLAASYSRRSLSETSVGQGSERRVSASECSSTAASGSVVLCSGGSMAGHAFVAGSGFPMCADRQPSTALLPAAGSGTGFAMGLARTKSLAATAGMQVDPAAN
ncbi:hypothetical protein HYH03_014110 [Edaphochlamys debaryana]|uniref:PPM-type phosphatase domain-containing protein n=1 Tax=Edaphochlamys debaryana TaxID=47281 RepID=A0A836BTW4_9CHLO|nr:hypothetical protein HYH03_014110 [Edaphochlamys debaryana]|eukprot:KAG2487269.1 hypothetical protein HYH03_014110 [Edaphochlamys debaryana]